MKISAAAVAVLLVLSSCSGLRRNSADVAQWQVPRFPEVRLVMRTPPPDAGGYGAKLVAVHRKNGVVAESPRLFDTDFIVPRFITFDDRTLMLADFGSEDVWGLMVWSIERDAVRNLGVLDVALPGDSFTAGAAPEARVALEDGRYVITIPGPLLLEPSGRGEIVLAEQGESARFVQSASGMKLVEAGRIRMYGTSRRAATSSEPSSRSCSAASERAASFVTSNALMRRQSPSLAH